MENFLEDSKYINTGSIISKKELIELYYNIETKQTEFYVKRKSLLGKTQYADIGQGMKKTFDEVFNLVEDDNLYSGTLNDFDFESYSNRGINDDKFKDLFKETLKQIFAWIRENFGECNSKNLEARLNSMEVEIVDDSKYNACFMRWGNKVVISRNVISNPKLHNNVLAHEIFHILGTDTELLKNGNIKKSTSRNTGFESKGCFGKGINEGFVQKYANIICPYPNIYTFETRVADMIELILDDDMAKENSYSDTSKLETITRDRRKYIRLIKLLDNYHMLKNRYIENKSILNKYDIKFNFITEIEKEITDIYFENVFIKLTNEPDSDQEEIIEKAKEFKSKLVFMENIQSELDIHLKELFVDDFKTVITNWQEKSKSLNRYFEECLTNEELKSEKYLLNNIKNICQFTYNITDVFEILDQSFKQSLHLDKNDKVYLITQMMDHKRRFYVVVRNKDDKIYEILNNDVEIIKDMKDATLYDNLNVIDEIRERERRHTNERTFSIYMTLDGEFGIADLVDKQNRILRALTMQKLNISGVIADDSLEDFSYLNSYIKPKKFI